MTRESAADPPEGPSRRTVAAKVRQAANNPQRPGAGCKAQPGAFAPVVDRRRCEGKSECVQVCP
ncbi:MAG TPA: hypothetical protein VK801_00005, partial [Caulobacteraceae bacterium]|nr:hypothetical protein [Caulobacteraceae bacterium]